MTTHPDGGALSLLFIVFALLLVASTPTDAELAAKKGQAAKDAADTDLLAA